MGTLKPQSNGPLYSNTVIDALAVDGWVVNNIWYSKDGQAVVPPSPLLGSHPVTSSLYQM